MAFIEKLSEISAAKAALARQEAQLNAERQEALASLPDQFGYPDLKSFIEALKAAPKSKKAKLGPKTKDAKPSKRIRLTPEAKHALVEAAKNGKSGAELVREFGVSIATVHNLKKAAGLIKTRV